MVLQHKHEFQAHEEPEEDGSMQIEQDQGDADLEEERLIRQAQ